MKNNTHFKTALVGAALAITAFCFHGHAHASQADVDADIANYITVLKGSDLEQQRQALKTLEWSGISSEKVYDVVAENLLRLKDTKDKQERKTASWYAKALGFSGMEKYRSTLSNVAENAKAKKVDKYAAGALNSLEKYRQWNAVISANDISAPTGRLTEARVEAMLFANDLELVRLGAKRVYWGHKTDAQLIGKAAQRLETEFPKASKDNSVQIDAIAWLIKALAESGNAQYKPLLTRVANEATVKKVKKYAKKYADYL